MKSTNAVAMQGLWSISWTITITCPLKAQSMVISTQPVSIMTHMARIHWTDLKDRLSIKELLEAQLTKWTHQTCSLGYNPSDQTKNRWSYLLSINTVAQKTMMRSSDSDRMSDRQWGIKVWAAQSLRKHRSLRLSDWILKVEPLAALRFHRSLMISLLSLLLWAI